MKAAWSGSKSLPKEVSNWLTNSPRLDGIAPAPVAGIELSAAPAGAASRKRWRLDFDFLYRTSGCGCSRIRAPTLSGKLLAKGRQLRVVGIDLGEMLNGEFGFPQQRLRKIKPNLFDNFPGLIRVNARSLRDMLG